MGQLFTEGLYGVQVQCIVCPKSRLSGNDFTHGSYPRSSLSGDVNRISRRGWGW